MLCYPYIQCKIKEKYLQKLTLNNIAKNRNPIQIYNNLNGRVYLKENCIFKKEMTLVPSSVYSIYI